MNKLFSTSQRILHVFICDGPKAHVHPGFEISRIGKMECPICGASIRDVTDEPIGQSYFAFARPDLGAKK